MSLIPESPKSVSRIRIRVFFIFPYTPDSFSRIRSNAFFISLPNSVSSSDPFKLLTIEAPKSLNVDTTPATNSPTFCATFLSSDSPLLIICDEDMYDLISDARSPMPPTKSINPLNIPVKILEMALPRPPFQSLDQKSSRYSIILASMAPSGDNNSTIESTAFSKRLDF